LALIRCHDWKKTCAMMVNCQNPSRLPGLSEQFRDAESADDECDDAQHAHRAQNPPPREGDGQTYPGDE
jgi:hypothetical protein